MKKMFTLLALLTMFLGANAKEVVDAEVDFSKYNDISEWGFPNSWGGSQSARDRLTIQNGCLHYESTEATDPTWDVQFFPIGGVNAEVGTVYTLHYKVKGDHAGNVSMLGFGLTPYDQFSITTDWVEGTVDYEAKSVDGNILMQCGGWVGSWDIAYLKITHEERDNQRPKEWIELLENGDAETPWADPNIRFNDQENNYKICAWGKEKGVNLNENGGWDPFPATIEDDGTGNHVFVVHGKAADTEGDASAWDNQFWIEAPRQLKPGELLKVHFRYKASEAATTNTQIHHQNPSDYQFYQCLGDINFTTEWQVFDKEISWPSGSGENYVENAWSIAFNLNPSNKNAVDFYFDDLSISELKLDHGLFAASPNTKTGSVAYNFDNAVELEAASGEIEWTNPQTGKKVSVDVSGTFVGTVGEKGKPDTWVNEVMISTVRGHDGTFKSNTIKPTKGSFTGLDPDDWKDYEEASNAKISLPAAGAWLISVVPADGGKQMLFLKLDGEDNAEPLEEIANPTEITVKGQARVDLQDEWDNNNQTVNVREEADNNPDDEHGIGGEGHTGQTWDNQFFIVANRTLAKGEVTILKFKYKSSVDNAKTTTQCHVEPGAYKHWAAIGDVTFNTGDWATFEQTFTVPDEADGMKSIAFNMAEIKEACDYQIKDVIWMTEDHMETLINTTGDENFYVKEGAGTAPYVPSGISTVVNEKKVSNNVIYNLAGQRVSKDYKGIVIKNGAKYIVK